MKHEAIKNRFEGLLPAFDRYIGGLVGLAVGDALGAPLEFHPPGTFEPIEDMVDGGAFNLRAGQWTDDTAMALCLADSLIAFRGFDPLDQLRRYVRWFRQGHLSSTGKCFGIGNTIRASLVHFEKTGAPCCETVPFPDTGKRIPGVRRLTKSLPGLSKAKTRRRS